MKRIAITGPNGYIGKALTKFSNFIPLSCDITNKQETRLAIEKAKPDIVVNLACLSKVDFCEDRRNQEKVMQANLRGAHHVCDAAERMNIPVVLLSTDHVFSGKWGPFRSGPYGEKSTPSPVNFYGMTKMAMEGMATTFDNCKVIRTSRLFDRSTFGDFDTSNSYPTFIKRSFMYLPHFVIAIKVYLNSIQDMPRLLHLSGSETTSWYDFMRYVFHEFRLDENDVMKRTGEYPNRFAPRPHHAGLKTKLSKEIGIPQFSFMDGINAMRKDSLAGELGYV